MAVKMFKKCTKSLCREWPVPAGTQADTIVLHPISNQVGYTLTARGDATTGANVPGITGGTIKNGGVGNKENAATVAVDGSWRIAVTGVVNGDTNPETGTAGTASGTAVYRLTASPNTISLTATGGVKIGVVDDGVIVGGIAPVLIGAVL